MIQAASLIIRAYAVIVGAAPAPGHGRHGDLIGDGRGGTAAHVVAAYS